MKLKTCSQDIGAEKIFALENYTERNPKRTVETEAAVISFCMKYLATLSIRAEHRLDPDQEMMDRKWFVLEFIHARELRPDSKNQREMNEGESKMERRSKK
ncbi:hypothetical protein GDO81_025685 [Engystomops pustulosus]|uniref:Uncharacterized protein n=1 Tax=Engystomops pustulosus TaxID=76066 RepID=A0AAV6ZJA8_ENGPU|nr:hypothetical protein GDO81_025685 [Engystomops pustulosus]